MIDRPTCTRKLPKQPRSKLNFRVYVVYVCPAVLFYSFKLFIGFGHMRKKYSRYYTAKSVGAIFVLFVRSYHTVTAVYR